MAEQLSIDKSRSDEEIYKSLIPVIEGIVSADEPVISVLSNITAVLKEAFNKISWAGFYLRKDNSLYLGPFQGKIACTFIPLGKGVCGTAASEKETIIVDDVNAFEGHIVCDSEAKSEIVAPIVSNGDVYGVIDLDSTSLSAFNSTDREYLEAIARIIAQKIDLEKLKNIII